MENKAHYVPLIYPYKMHYSGLQNATVSYNAKLSIQDPSFTHSWENASMKFPWNLLMYESYSDQPLPTSNVVDMIIITLH